MVVRATVPTRTGTCAPASVQVTLALVRLLNGELRVRATLNKSLARAASLLWAAYRVANPRHSQAMTAVCALPAIPNQGAPHRGDLFSVALERRKANRSLRG